MKRFNSHLIYCLVTGLAVLATGLGVSSCGSSRKGSRTASYVRPQKPGPRASDEVADALVNEARTWLGVPYVYGGTSRDGADCSGFLVQVYKAAADISLPRTTSEQQTFCAPLKPSDIAVGDILFFTSKNSGSKVAHVGMYVGGNRMIHASSSRGVVEDDITLPYYRTHYCGVGRVPHLAAARSHKDAPAVTPVLPRTGISVPLDSLGSIFARKEPVSVGSDSLTVSLPPVSMDTVTVHSRRLPVIRRQREHRSDLAIAAPAEIQNRPTESATTTQPADTTVRESIERVVVRNAFSKKRRDIR